MKMVMRSLLLGTAAGLVAMSGALAADLPTNKARHAEYVKVSGYYMVVSPGAIHASFYRAQIDIPANDGSIVFKSMDSVMSPRIASVPAYAARAHAYRMSEGAGLGDKIGQKLRSSATYRGSASHGFNHVVIGKRPMFATKMIA